VPWPGPPDGAAAAPATQGSGRLIQCEEARLGTRAAEPQVRTSEIPQARNVISNLIKPEVLMLLQDLGP
jgi:hypothetical protein